MASKYVASHEPDQAASKIMSNRWKCSPKLAGWTHRKSYGRGSEFLARTIFFADSAWRKKWLSLNGTELSYMSKYPTVENVDTLVIKKQDLDVDTIVSPGDHSSFNVMFKLNGTRSTWQFRCKDEEERRNWVMGLTSTLKLVEEIDQYEKIKVLGVGGQGIVHLAQEKSSGRQFAMKVMAFNSSFDMSCSINEVKILKQISEFDSHPHVMEILKSFELGSKVIQIYPLCSGGELFDHVVSRGHFSENDAAIIMNQLFAALDCLHRHNIAHMDIKPENILFVNKDPHSEIMLIDFGMAVDLSSSTIPKPTPEILKSKLDGLIDRGEVFVDARGTVGYMSPEVILTGYGSPSSDVFAAGVLLFQLLSGHQPFYKRSFRETIINTCTGL
jgi:serine/threonine protein kinase